jgi:hypothetical protein
MLRSSVAPRALLRALLSQFHLAVCAAPLVVIMSGCDTQRASAPSDGVGGAKLTLEGVASVDAPVVGAMRVTGKENATCAGARALWTFCQHQTDKHDVYGGIGLSDDTFAWDANATGANGEANADSGKPVYAVAAGTVVKYAGLVAPGEGACRPVLVQHSANGKTFWSGYLHLASVLVVENQVVTPATQLGTVGRSCADNDHLHFVVYTGSNSSGALLSRDVPILERSMAPPTASKVVFTTQPGNGVTGSPLATQPVAKIQDANGNVVTTSTALVTLGIGTNPANGALSGSPSVSAVNGVATFSGVSLSTAGNGYTLTASSTGLTGATSNTFNITAPAAPTANRVVFTTQPGNGVAGSPLTTQPVAKVVDVNGNVVTTSTALVILAIGTNPATGTISGSLSVSAINGVATFSGVSLSTAGNGYTLTASSTGLTSATSNTFNVTAPAAPTASKVVFTTQPGNGVTGSPLATQPVAKVVDVNGDVVTTSTALVILAIGTNPASGVISGSLSVSAINGVATFSGVTISAPGNGYTLTASSTGLTGATSNTFNVTAPAAPTANKVVFTTQPGNGVAGSPLATQPVVKVQDVNGNVMTTSTASVTVAIGTNSGNGALAGTATVNAVNGVATFSGLSISTAGNGYTLTASSTGLTGATSSTFNVTAPAAPTAPTAPTNLLALALSHTQVALSWTDNSSDESRFELERAAGYGGTYSLRTTLSANTFVTTDAVQAGVVYFYRVRACNATGCSGYSNQPSVVP